MPQILDYAKEIGFEIAANFVFGFPGETWDQIRDTCRYAEKINVDKVRFHIATPLPGTELMRQCIEDGYLKSEGTNDVFGYTRGVIETPEFTPLDLQILRAFEWDRINFSDSQCKEVMARMEGITMEELEQWRKWTRQNLGVTTDWTILTNQ